MKRIKLNQMKKPDKSSIFTNAHQHTLCLGNGIKLSFSNKRAFDSAVYHVNEELTEILYQLNDEFVFCFTEYRRSWFYLENQHFNVLHKSDEYIMELTRLFNLLSDRNGWTNGNYFAFKYFYLIIENLIGWICDLIELRHQKKQYVEMRIMQRKQKEIAAIRLLLENIGKETD